MVHTHSVFSIIHTLTHSYTVFVLWIINNRNHYNNDNNENNENDNDNLVLYIYPVHTHIVQICVRLCDDDDDDEKHHPDKDENLQSASRTCVLVCVCLRKPKASHKTYFAFSISAFLSNGVHAHIQNTNWTSPTIRILIPFCLDIIELFMENFPLRFR